MIIPFMDYRNYITTDSVCAISTSHPQPFDNIDRSHEHTHILDKQTHTLRVVTDKPIRKGRQVYLNYETYPSHFYLLHYGFVAVSNIHDCLLVPLPNATALSPLLQQVLQTMGFPSDNTMCLDFTRYLNDKALAFFLLRHASPEHLQRCLTYYDEVVVQKQKGRWEATDVHRCALGVWEDDPKTRWERASEGLKAELKEHLLHVASAYPTSIAYDNVRRARDRDV